MGVVMVQSRLRWVRRLMVGVAVAAVVVVYLLVQVGPGEHSTIWLINEGREYLDQNPEPSGFGDVTLIQGAMQPLERIINPPEPMTAPAAAQAGGDSGARPEPQPQPAKQRADVAAAFTGLFAEVYGRQLKVEADKARRADRQNQLQAWASEFYAADLVARVQATLTPVVTALLAAIGGKTEQAADHATRLAHDHAAQSRADLQTNGGRAVDGWESERATKQAAQAVQILLGAK